MTLKLRIMKLTIKTAGKHRTWQVDHHLNIVTEDEQVSEEAVIASSTRWPSAASSNVNINVNE